MIRERTVSGGGCEDGTDLAWRCVKTRPKGEHIAARHLQLHARVETFCPRIRFQRQTRRGEVWFSEALFPSYVFAKFSLAHSLRAVQSATAVTGLVQFGGSYPAIPQSTIDVLRSEFAGDQPKTLVRSLEVGDEVEIVSGPLDGLETRVTSIPTGGERVRVLMEMLGQEREVEVPIFTLLGFEGIRTQAFAMDG